MGNTINLSETLIIALGTMCAVFAILILVAISMLMKLSRAAQGSQSENSVQSNSVSSPTGSYAALQAPVQAFGEIDEEDRLVVALAASALTAESNPDSHFRISKITRIK